MKTLRELLPYAIALAVFAAVVSFLVGRNMAPGKWMLAAFLVGHGLVHIMFITPQPKDAVAKGVEYPFDLGNSWPTSVLRLDLRFVRIIAIALIVAVVAGFGLAGLATVGLLLPAGWWPALVLGSTALSALLLVVGLHRGLALGFAIDAALVVLVIGGAWAPGVAVIGG